VPERWERQVRKLGTVTAPPSTPARIADGPRAGDMPPGPGRRQRIMAAVLALVVSGATVGFLADAFRSSEPTAAAPSSLAGTSSPSLVTVNSSRLIGVLNAPSDGSMPRLTLSLAGRSATFDAQDGRWPGANLSPQATQVFGPVIEPGTALVLRSDATDVTGALWYSDADLRLTGASIPIDLSTRSATLPGESGLYRLTISGSWPSGEAGFNVAIRIGTPPSDWPPTPPIVAVPDVVGLGQREAIALLTDAGFVSVSVAIPAGQNTGVVTSQDPAPGTRSDVTGTIKLTVSANG
jgi:PASTA domain